MSILVPNGDGNNLSSIVGAYKIFNKANEYSRQIGKEPVFNIQLVGDAASVEFFDGLFTVKPHTTITYVSKTDMVIIPSLNHHFREALQQNDAIAGWIEERYKGGAEVASICTGAFLLAATGLLDGKSCSTHWSAADSFRTMFPNVQLRADRLITDEKGIYTNGGAYSFLNLVIYLVEKYYGRPTAIYCSKVFQVDMTRNSQNEFAVFTGQKQHDDEVVLLAQEYIEHNLDQKITVEDLSARFNVSRRNFDRRFIKATGNTPIEYFQRVKIEAAKKALETNRKTINEVMYEVGYSDVKAFREVFRKITGISPLEYKNKYYRYTVQV